MTRRIARLLAPYKGSLLLVALAVIVAAALTSVAPFLTKAVFDRALFPPSGGPDLKLLGWLVAGLIAIPLLAALIGIGQNYLTSKVGNSAMADLRSALFEHLQRMELAFFTATKTGAIQSRLANDVNGVRTVLTSTATSILANVVTVAAAFTSMVILSWKLTIITLILMPIFIFIQIKVGRRRQRLARKTQESLSEMTAITEESLSVSGILLAKVFNRSELESRRYRAENRRQTRLQVKATMTGQSFFAVVSTFFAITPAIIYLVAGRMAVGGAAVTAGTIVAFTTLQARLQSPLMSLMRVSLDVQTSVALFRRIFEYLDLVPAIVDRPQAIAIDPTTLRGAVELRDVWFKYPPPRQLSEAGPSRGRVPSGGGGGGGGGRMGFAAIAEPAVSPGSGASGSLGLDSLGSLGLGSGAPGLDSLGSPGSGLSASAAEASVGLGNGRLDDLPEEIAAIEEPFEPVAVGERWALSGLSMRIEPGQFAAIVGPSGSGKTTTTYLVPRFYDVDRGACLIDGVDVRDVTMGSLAEAVGMVTQEPYLFHGTIRDNLAYAKPGAAQEEIEQAARDANIHDRIMSFEHGYETITGERGYRLSGGEKQRLAIARVLLMNPRVLILDEATSALDTETERLVQEALERATHNRTTIAIAHRLSTIMGADVIFGLEDGKLVEQGTHDELLARGGLYWRLYTEQFGAGQVEARLADGVRFTDGTLLCDHGPHVHTDIKV